MKFRRTRTQGPVNVGGLPDNDKHSKQPDLSYSDELAWFLQCKARDRTRSSADYFNDLLPLLADKFRAPSRAGASGTCALVSELVDCWRVQTMSRPVRDAALCVAVASSLSARDADRRPEVSLRRGDVTAGNFPPEVSMRRGETSRGSAPPSSYEEVSISRNRPPMAPSSSSASAGFGVGSTSSAPSMRISSSSSTLPPDAARAGAAMAGSGLGDSAAGAGHRADRSRFGIDASSGVPLSKVRRRSYHYRCCCAFTDCCPCCGGSGRSRTLRAFALSSPLLPDWTPRSCWRDSGPSARSAVLI